LSSHYIIVFRFDSQTEGDVIKSQSMGMRQSCFLFLAALIGSTSPAKAGTSTVPEPGDLRAAGQIEFPISGAAGIRPEFERGVALLHSFFYEEARRIFTGVAQKDPNCAMAQWGIAMTWWHPIWTPPTPEEMKAGSAAIDKATAMIRLRPAERDYGITSRERRFIAA